MKRKKRALEQQAPATNLTAEQLANFSAEWCAFFDSLVASGYSIKYDDGLFMITGHGAEMMVRLWKGRWTMSLISWQHTTTRSSRYDDPMREQILFWLNTARQNSLFQKDPFGGTLA